MRVSSSIYVVRSGARQHVFVLHSDAAQEEEELFFSDCHLTTSYTHEFLLISDGKEKKNTIKISKLTDPVDQSKLSLFCSLSIEWLFICIKSGHLLIVRQSVSTFSDSITSTRDIDLRTLCSWLTWWYTPSRTVSTRQTRTQRENCRQFWFHRTVIWRSTLAIFEKKKELDSFQ